MTNKSIKETKETKINEITPHENRRWTVATE